MEEYTLCQVVIPNNGAGSLPGRLTYTVGLNGRYKVRLIGISWADTTNTNDNRLIRISSDCFRSINGTFQQTIMFCNRAEKNLGNPQGEFPFFMDTVGGQIDLSVASNVPYDGGANNAFSFAILTFKVAPIPRE